MGPTQLKTALVKTYLGSIYAMLMYIDVIAIIRFLQVCVWKRVMEINEELTSRCLNRSLIGINFFLGMLCHPDYKIHTFIFMFSGENVEMPQAACKDDIDPFDNKYFLPLN